MEKLHDYQGLTGRFHELRDNARNKYTNYREEHPEKFFELVKTVIKNKADPTSNQNDNNQDEYSHVARNKTRSELIRISSAVMGIEFSYAAETAFVSPTLLKIGVEHQHMTLVWALSPLIGFFLTPILGSLSDRCRLNLGRRRPFIILLSIGVFLGLLLVPNGEYIGYSFGDFNPYAKNMTNTMNNIKYNRVSASETEINVTTTTLETPNQPNTSHSWGIFFTILGTVLLDFDADACQSPARAYLLDVTIPEDHAKGLSTFTIMAGLGGFMGYSLGGINWDVTALGILLGGHVRAVFTLVTFIFIFCVSATITSFKEIPLSMLEAQPEQVHDFLAEDENQSVDENKPKHPVSNFNDNSNHETDDVFDRQTSYGAVSTEIENLDVPLSSQKRKYNLPPLPINSEYTSVSGGGEGMDHENGKPINGHGESVATLSHYLMSIVLMPHSLRMVCLTNLFCWMAHVCYSLYFTDFVGEAVFGGDPKAMDGTEKQILYEDGVRFGCWGMAMYSLSCACYSTVIEKLIKQFGAKKVYVGGLLFYCIGMTLMALTRARVSVIVFSWTAGVMYSTLFTMPYLLVAHYHAQGTFEVNEEGNAKLGTEIRGLGTDVAIVSSMVFLAQFILSICMGSIVSFFGTTTTVVSLASILSFCGAISATQIMYLDL